MASYNNCLPEGLSKSPTIQKVTGLTKESSAEKKGGGAGGIFEGEWRKASGFLYLEEKQGAHAKISKKT